ncbi:MAG TPA: SgcJ/EcaC family oxidoreductase [Solirubrobacteraceae bacterium]|nr:SgcJ/EcaC family oxidoreductase [Solirubrobacteraceae bacterium]
MISPMHTPDGTVEHFSELLEARRLDALLGLYEEDATFVPEPGRVVSGRAAIREELERLVALNPCISGRVEQVLQAGDTALVTYRWQMQATAPDGTAVQQGGLSADVLRRRPDGSWGVIIDDPYGATGATGGRETADA